MRKHFNRVYPVSKAFINDLRKGIQRRYGKDFEQSMTDRGVLEMAEYQFSKSYIDDVFKNGDYLPEDKVIEF